MRLEPNLTATWYAERERGHSTHSWIKKLVKEQTYFYCFVNSIKSLDKENPLLITCESADNNYAFISVLYGH